MGLDLDSRGGRGRRSQLWIECTGQSVTALCRKARRRIEQPEVPRIRHVDDALLELGHRPTQKILQWRRHFEIEGVELRPEFHHVDGRYDAAAGNSLVREQQF